MDYPDFVDQVMRSFATLWRSGAANVRVTGITTRELCSEMGLAGEIEMEAVGEALRDLQALGLIDGDWRRNTITQEGRKFPDASIASAWPDIFAIYLDSEQEAFLALLARLSVEEHGVVARVREIHADEVMAAPGENWDIHAVSELAKSLEQVGMVRRNARMGCIKLYPTYLGVVRATNAEPHEWQSLIRSLLPDWETTNLDFKLELKLERESAKAEFVRDVLGLANTKSSGRRFLVVGFGDASCRFEQSIDPSVTQERLEQILTAWSEPAPQVRLMHVPWDAGIAGVVEVFRDPARVPFLPTKASGKLRAGLVYARHGSHTEPATEAEQTALEEEGARARNAEATSGD